MINVLKKVYFLQIIKACVTWWVFVTSALWPPRLSSIRRWPSALLSQTLVEIHQLLLRFCGFFSFSLTDWAPLLSGPPGCKQVMSPVIWRGLSDTGHILWSQQGPFCMHLRCGGNDPSVCNSTQSHALCMLVIYCNMCTARAPPTTCCPSRVLFLCRENVCHCGEILRFSSRKHVCCSFHRQNISL